MKKKLLMAIWLVIAGMAGHSQSFDKGTHAFNLGTGFVNTPYIHTSYYEGFFPSATISYEYGLAKIPMGSKLNGVLSIGGYAGYCKSEYNIYENGDHYNCNDLTFGVRGNYHFIFDNRFDPYTGLWIGVNMPSHQWEGEWEEPVDIHFAHKNGPAAGAYVGARWFFTDHIAVYSEIGWLVSIFNVGVTIKL